MWDGFSNVHDAPSRKYFTRDDRELSPIRRSTYGRREPDDIDLALSLSSPHRDDRWYLEGVSPVKLRRDGGDRVVDSLQRFRKDLSQADDGYSRHVRDLQLDIDDSSSEYGSYGFPPPKPSDSINIGRRPSIPGRAIAEGSYYDDYGTITPRGSSASKQRPNTGPGASRYSSYAGTPLRSSSPNPTTTRGSHIAPRSPPGKVGAVMWGSDTPLANKGQPPRIDKGEKWCCAVCYYTENKSTAQQCEVCDSQNYTKNKVSCFSSYY